MTLVDARGTNLPIATPKLTARQLYNQRRRDAMEEKKRLAWEEKKRRVAEREKLALEAKRKRTAERAALAAERRAYRNLCKRSPEKLQLLGYTMREIAAVKGMEFDEVVRVLWMERYSK